MVTSFTINMTLNITLELTEKLDSTQYSAILAMATSEEEPS